MNREFHRIFGDINAEDDDLLFKCRVKKTSSQFQKEVITGRWGSGKTAQMLLQNEGQINYLEKNFPDQKMIWYLSERNIVEDRIVELFDSQKNNIYRFETVLKSMWKAEILRIYVFLLNAYLPQYNIDRKSDHWKAVISIKSKHNFIESTSKYLGIISKMIFRDGKQEVDKLQNSVDDMLNEKTYTVVRKCLKDLAVTNQFIPQIVIEPIETPHSNFEKTRSLAESVVRALIDIYMAKFYKSSERPFKVRLVIPWHRLTSQVKFPQKQTDFIGFVSWKRDELYQFISNRIEWELKAVGRKLTRRHNMGSWYELFDSKVKNGWVKSSFQEDSFSYFLRHTHFRARDIINLCKKCVEHAFDNSSFSSKDDVLRTGFITQKIIKETFHEYNHDAAKELLEEAVRKYKGFGDYIEALYRLPIVFTYNELEKRLTTYSIGENVEEVMIKLWESGFIGVTVETNTKDKIDLIETFGNKTGKNIVDSHYRWTWFFYNSKKTPIEILRMIESVKCTNYGMCLHPKLFETFTPIVSTKLNVPIGVS